MISINEFCAVVESETGIPLEKEEDLNTPLDELDGWSSIYVLSIASELRRQHGATVDLARAFDSRTLRDVWVLAAE